MYLWMRIEFTHTLNPINGWEILVHGPWFKNCYTIVSNMIIWITYTSHPTWYECIYTVKTNPVSNRLMIEGEVTYKNTSEWWIQVQCKQSEWDRDDNLDSSSFSISELNITKIDMPYSILSIFILDLHNLPTILNGRTSSDRL